MKKKYVVTNIKTIRETYHVLAVGKSDALTRCKSADGVWDSAEVIKDTWLVASDVSPLRESA